MDLEQRRQQVLGRNYRPINLQSYSTNNSGISNSFLQRRQQILQASTQRKPIQQPVIKLTQKSKPNIIQQAENGVENFFNTVKNEFTPQTKPLPKLGKVTPTQLPSGLKLDFVTPSQNANAIMKVTPKSLQQQAKVIKILKPIEDQINLTQNQIDSGFSDLLNKGVVHNMAQVAPRKEYFTQKQYDQAVKNSKQQTFTKSLNSFLGTTIATAPLMLLGGQFVDPLLAKIAMRVPGGTNILTNALSLMTKAVIRSAPYGTLGALAPAKNVQDRLKNTATGVAVASVLGIGITGADAIASELVNKFGNDAVNFLANKELITKVVTGKATPEEIKQFNILNESGLTAEAARSKEGISINTTQQKQGKMWDILRYIFNNHYQPKTQGTENTVPSEQTATATQQTDNNLKLLQPGEYKPAEVRKIVLSSPLKNTPEGQNLIRQTITAENQGKNVKITHVQAETKQLPATTEVTPKKPVYNSAQSRAIQAQFTETLGKLRESAHNEQEWVKGIDAAVSKAETLANGDKTVLAGIRTALNKEMYGMVGTTGNYKQDYAILQQMKSEGGIGDVLKNLDEHINRISENMLKPSPEIIQKPSSGKNLLNPVGTGEVKASKLAERVTKAMGFYKDIPEYNTASNKDQAQMATDLVAKDPKQAFNIAMGIENAPKGMLPAFTYEAVRANAEAVGDITTLRALATQSKLSLQGTAAGQFIQSLSQVDPTSSVAYMKQAIEAKKQLAKAQLKGKSVDKIKNVKVDKLKSDISKAAPTKNDWQSFIDSIQC